METEKASAQEWVEAEIQQRLDSGALRIGQGISLEAVLDDLCAQLAHLIREEREAGAQAERKRWEEATLRLHHDHLKEMGRFQQAASLHEERATAIDGLREQMGVKPRM